MLSPQAYWHAIMGHEELDAWWEIPRQPRPIAASSLRAGSGLTWANVGWWKWCVGWSCQIVITLIDVDYNNYFLPHTKRARLPGIHAMHEQHVLFALCVGFLILKIKNDLLVHLWYLLYCTYISLKSMSPDIAMYLFWFVSFTFLIPASSVSDWKMFWRLFLIGNCCMWLSWQHINAQ